MLERLLNGRLAGEGSLVRHLRQLGYELQHSQAPRAEFDYSLQHMSVDLRDGIRLCRLAEVLTGGLHNACSRWVPVMFSKQCSDAKRQQYTLYGQLFHQRVRTVVETTHVYKQPLSCAAGEALMDEARVPARRRPLQLHNMSLALNSLEVAGLNLMVSCTLHSQSHNEAPVILHCRQSLAVCTLSKWTSLHTIQSLPTPDVMLCCALQALQTSRGPIPLQPDDIVAGEREVTLGLLWRIYQHFEASRQ